MENSISCESASEACPTAKADMETMALKPESKENSEFLKQSLASCGLAERDANSLQFLEDVSLDLASLSIHGDTVGEKEKEAIASLLCSSSLEDDALFEEKNKFQELVPMQPKASLNYGCGNTKKLLILDLNGVLADAVNDYHIVRGEHKRIGGKPFFKRPFCDDFLKFCFDKFDVGVWSSRRKHNIDSAVDYLLGEFKEKLLFCWDQSKCTYTGVNTLENCHKPLFLKELTRLWNKKQPELPWKKGDYSPSNTLLIDDSPYKALCNPPHTAIFPHPYKYNGKRDVSLGPGGDLRIYLEHIVMADDVQQYVKEHPFGQSAITASNKDWNFYSKIIERHGNMLMA